MTSLATAVKRQVIVVHECVRIEYLVLPIGLLLGIVEVDRIELLNLHDVGVTEAEHVQPRTEAVLHVIGNLLCAVTHRADTQFGLHKVLALEHIHLFPAILESPVRIEVDVHLAFATGLGSDDDHTVGSTATVDSGGRSVLEDLHRLDVGRRQPFDVTRDHSIDHIQRVVTAQSRTDTADTDGSRLTGLTRTGSDCHTGGTALQRLVQTGNRRLE